jgi:hypothetical protein
MQSKVIIGLLLICALGLVEAAAPPCRFAPLFDQQELISNPKTRDAFLRASMYWEGQFHKVGFSESNGLTFDGTGLNYSTGEPAAPLHYWTAASKESIHMMMLARALEGNEYARIFVSPDDQTDSVVVDRVLTILERKVTTLEDWNDNYPGFGGYLPWVANYPSGVVPMPAWTNSVPALDNGEMIWGLYACKVATQSRSDQRSLSLAARMSSYLGLLASTARTVFYAGQGHIRAVATIKDPQAAPTDPSNYGMDCNPKISNCWLDDPYEGELFAVFMDLYSQWPNQTDRDSVWVAKRAKLQSVTYTSGSGPITVQRGFWFSSHEQWKYLELPYLSASPINKRVFLNGERARTHHSSSRGIPGLYASVTDVCPPGQQPPDYISAVGVQSIAFMPILRRDLITPYGAYPVMLADLGVGLAWYHNMLNGTAMQGPLGSTESINVGGTMIAPVVTWDSKITTACAMIGGVADLVGSGLKLDGTYSRFADVINREWNLAFPSLQGEQIPFAAPSVSLPQPGVINDFTTCHN